MEEKKYIIPVEILYNLLKEFDIKINELGAMLNYKDYGKSPDSLQEKYKAVEQDFEEVLETLATPYNIAYVKTVLPDDTCVRTTVLTGKFRTLLMGKNHENYNIKPLETNLPQDVFTQYLNEGIDIISSGTDLEIDYDTMIIILAIADFRKRVQINNLIEHKFESILLTKEYLKAEILDAFSHGDPRWLTPFVLSILNPEMKINIDGALNELQEIGFLNIQNDEIKLSENGEKVIDSLVRRRVLLSVKSHYIDAKGDRICNFVVFIKTDFFLWGLNFFDDRAFLSSIDYEDAHKILEKMFEQGYEPAVDTHIKTQTETKTSEGIDKGHIYCHECGAKVDSGLNFCTQCGTPVKKKEPKNKNICLKCNMENDPNVNYCVNCGNKLNSTHN